LWVPANFAFELEEQFKCPSNDFIIIIIIIIIIIVKGPCRSVAPVLLMDLSLPKAAPSQHPHCSNLSHVIPHRLRPVALAMLSWRVGVWALSYVGTCCSKKRNEDNQFQVSKHPQSVGTCYTTSKHQKVSKIV